MPTLLKGKPGKGEYMDALGIALAKTMGERILSPMIGNGTIQSGIIKGIAGAVIPAVAGQNKIGKIVSTALIVDSAEDLISGFLGGSNILGGGTQRGVI